MTRYNFATSLSWGGDEPTAEMEVEVDFTAQFGSPETGRFGAPENYDPGAHAEVEDIRVLKIDGREGPFDPDTVKAILGRYYTSRTQNDRGVI